MIEITCKTVSVYYAHGIAIAADRSLPAEHIELHREDSVSDYATAQYIATATLRGEPPPAPRPAAEEP